MTEEEESDEEFEWVGETDAERREGLLASDQDIDESNKLGHSDSWKALEQEFDFNNNQNQATSSKVPIDDAIILLTDDDDDDDDGNIPIAYGSTFTHGFSSAAKDKGMSSSIKGNASSKARHSKSNAIGLGRMAEAEIDFRKKESLGMASVKGSERTLGSRSRSTGMTQIASSTPIATQWNCLVCTLSVTFYCDISLCFVLIYMCF